MPGTTAPVAGGRRHYTQGVCFGCASMTVVHAFTRYCDPCVLVGLTTAGGKVFLHGPCAHCGKTQDVYQTTQRCLRCEDEVTATAFGAPVSMAPAAASSAGPLPHAPAPSGNIPQTAPVPATAGWYMLQYTNGTAAGTSQAAAPPAPGPLPATPPATPPAVSRELRGASSGMCPACERFTVVWASLSGQCKRCAGINDTL